MRPLRSLTLSAAMLALLLQCMAHARPALADPSRHDRDWELTLFGYGWLSSLKADLTAGPTTVELDESIVDLVPQLTWVLAGGVDARWDRVVFGLDALGQQLQISESAPGRSFALDPLGGPFGGLTGTRGASNVSIRTTEVMAEAFLGWRALSTPVSRVFPSVADDDPRRIALDVFGGARYWYWRTKVRLNVPPTTINAANPPAFPSGLRGRILERIFDNLDLPSSIQAGGSNAVAETVVSWTDALIGLRVAGDVSRSVSLTFRADIGGFGLGDSSDFSWQVMPGVQWRFSDRWIAAFNWRALGLQRKAVDDLVFYGALLGIGYRF